MTENTTTEPTFADRARAVLARYDDAEAIYTAANETAEEERRTVSSDDLWAHDDELAEVAHNAAALLRDLLAAPVPGTIPTPTDGATSSTLHTFQPNIDLRRNTDGSWSVDWDWSDAYLGGMDPDEELERDDRHPEGPEADAAVSRFITALGVVHTIPAAEPDACDIGQAGPATLLTHLIHDHGYALDKVEAATSALPGDTAHERLTRLHNDVRGITTY